MSEPTQSNQGKNKISIEFDLSEQQKKRDQYEIVYSVLDLLEKAPLKKSWITVATKMSGRVFDKYVERILVNDGYVTRQGVYYTITDKGRELKMKLKALIEYRQKALELEKELEPIFSILKSMKNKEKSEEQGVAQVQQQPAEQQQVQAQSQPQQ